ncbi:hypothetical protein MMC25_001722 [Agyrium rufum]|nr:hypothetical protein [Agyrium rufum]
MDISDQRQNYQDNVANTMGDSHDTEIDDVTYRQPEGHENVLFLGVWKDAPKPTRKIWGPGPKNSLEPASLTPPPTTAPAPAIPAVGSPPAPTLTPGEKRLLAFKSRNDATVQKPRKHLLPKRLLDARATLALKRELTAGPTPAEASATTLQKRGPYVMMKPKAGDCLGDQTAEIHGKPRLHGLG